MPTSFELTAAELRDLVSPVLPFTADDLPILNAVLIESAGDYLTATTTDRYRIGIHRLLPDAAPPNGLRILIGVRELKQILATFRSSRTANPSLSFEVTDESVTVETGSALFGFLSARMTWQTLTASQYPAVKKIIRKALAQNASLTGMVGLNPTYVGEFRAAAPRGTPIRVWASGPNQPIAVTAGPDFVGAIMPVALNDQAPYDAAWWDPILGDAAKDETPEQVAS